MKVIYVGIEAFRKFFPASDRHYQRTLSRFSSDKLDIVECPYGLFVSLDTLCSFLLCFHSTELARSLLNFDWLHMVRLLFHRSEFEVDLNAPLRIGKNEIFSGFEWHGLLGFSHNKE